MLNEIDSLWTESRFLFFKDIGYYRVGGKTKEYRISTKDGGIYLGSVHWYNKWRRYCFFPAPVIVLEQECMRDIADFVVHKTDLYKQERGWK